MLFHETGSILKRRFDSSDIVQETWLRAHANLDRFRGKTEAEMVGWLQEILANSIADQVRTARATKRDVCQQRAVRVGSCRLGQCRIACVPDAPTLRLLDTRPSRLIWMIFRIEPKRH